ncbi:MAG: oligosaccharide flippase family protein [Kiritimatiellae bacterium]|nr:oligosaccharide flippase family protein [Kiritimatiellia bacterium]
MKLDFARNMKRNIAASAVNSGIRLLFPFLNRTLFLWLLGPEYLGLNGLFGSILGVLMLAELGFGSAVISSMYKPIADDDRDLACAYLWFYRMVYRWVGSIIFLIGLCLLPFLRKLVHGNVPPDVDLYILYLIHLVNTSASYFLFAYRGSVLSVHHRNDVLSNIRTFTSIVQYVVVFLILLLTRNYYLYVLATVVFTAISNLLIFRESRRLFPDIEPHGKLPSENRRRVLSDVKSIFLHKVGGVISYSFDNIVISAFLGLVAVAAYGNYYYVVTSVSGLIGVIYGSVIGGFGNKIHTETKEENFRLFMKMGRLTQMCILWSSAMMVALFQPFIAVWTKNDPTLVRHTLTPVLMVLYFYVNQSRQILLSFKTAAAIWKQDRWKPIVAGVVNLAFNLAFVIWLPDDYKLDGVIFSTIISYVAIQIPWETNVVFTYFFNRTQARTYWLTHLGFAIFTLVLCGVTWWTVSLVSLDGIMGLLVKGALAVVVSGVLMSIVYRKDIVSVFGQLCKRRTN